VPEELASDSAVYLSHSSFLIFHFLLFFEAFCFMARIDHRLINEGLMLQERGLLQFRKQVSIVI
jgi:hypothetical protein